MVQDAEENAESDKAKKDLVEAKNQVRALSIALKNRLKSTVIKLTHLPLKPWSFQ